MSSYTGFFERLQQIYAAMDRKYNETAAYYGFRCSGCKDNCCRTRFYHHTHLEYLYLLEGFQTLASEKQSGIKLRAEAICLQTRKAEKKGRPVRLLCPLNFDGLCILYPYRPMICRLHGIPHELRKPGQTTMFGSGCDEFCRRCNAKPYLTFDRTPFYFEMAQLENEFKRSAGFKDKIKMTIAEMIVRNQ